LCRLLLLLLLLLLFWWWCWSCGLFILGNDVAMWNSWSTHNDSLFRPTPATDIDIPCVCALYFIVLLLNACLSKARQNQQSIRAKAEVVHSLKWQCITNHWFIYLLCLFSGRKRNSLKAVRTENWRYFASLWWSTLERHDIVCQICWQMTSLTPSRVYCALSDSFGDDWSTGAWTEMLGTAGKPQVQSLVTTRAATG